MIGLIRKDLINIRGVMVYMLLLAAVFSVVFGNCAVMMPTMMLACLVGTTFTYDRGSGWDTFAVSVGTERRTIVGSKFVLSLILMSIGLATGILMTLVCNALFDYGIGRDMLVDAVQMALSAGMIVIAVSCTVNYAVNSDKALAATGLTSSLCVIIGVMAAMLVGSGDISLPTGIPTIMLAIGAIALVSGYATSQKLFSRRDL